jgi:hypothetical protein
MPSQTKSTLKSNQYHNNKQPLSVIKIIFQDAFSYKYIKNIFFSIKNLF